MVPRVSYRIFVWGGGNFAKEKKALEANVTQVNCDSSFQAVKITEIFLALRYSGCTLTGMKLLPVLKCD